MIASAVGTQPSKSIATKLITNKRVEIEGHTSTDC